MAECMGGIRVCEGNDGGCCCDMNPTVGVKLFCVCLLPSACPRCMFRGLVLPPLRPTPLLPPSITFDKAWGARAVSAESDWRSQMRGAMLLASRSDATSTSAWRAVSVSYTHLTLPTT